MGAATGFAGTYRQFVSLWHDFRSVTGTPAEKLALAKTLQSHRKKKLSDTLDGLCRLYVAEKNKTPRNYARLRELEIEIEGLDTSIRILGNEAEIAAGVVYHYYHRAADSIAVGQELHLKSPHVRIILWRLRLVAAELGYSTHVKCDARRALRAAAIAPPAPCDEVVAVRMFLEGKKICDIAEAFYVYVRVPLRAYPIRATQSWLVILGNKKTYCGRASAARGS